MGPANAWLRRETPRATIRRVVGQRQWRELDGPTGSSRRESALVRERREGLWVHYRTHPDPADCAVGVLRETQGGLAGILGYEERPLVSVHYVNDPRSSIIDALSTMVSGGL